MPPSPKRNPASPPLPPFAPSPPLPHSSPPFPPLHAAPTQSEAASRPSPINQPPGPTTGGSAAIATADATVSVCAGLLHPASLTTQFSGVSGSGERNDDPKDASCTSIAAGCGLSDGDASTTTPTPARAAPAN